MKFLGYSKMIAFSEVQNAFQGSLKNAHAKHLKH